MFHVQELEKLYCMAGKSYLIIYITGSVIKISHLQVYQELGKHPSCNSKILYRKKSKVAKQHKKGGQSAPRFQRLAQADHKRYVHSVLEKVTEIVRKGNSKFSGIIIAGNGTKKDVLSGLIRESLDTKVLGTLTCDGEPTVDEYLPFLEENTFLEEIKPLKEFMQLDENLLVVYGDTIVKDTYRENGLRKMLIHINYIRAHSLKIRKIQEDADKRGCEIVIIRGNGNLQNLFWEGYGGVGGFAWYSDTFSHTD